MTTSSRMPVRIRLAIAVVMLTALAGLLGRDMIKPSAAAARVPAAEAALVAATIGDGSGVVRATGERAKLINAALPFSQAPIQAARAFYLPTGEESLERRRALLCLTQAIYYEAGYEPLEGRRAVAQVVLNRMRHPAFPKSVCGVVYQRTATPVCQFTFVCDGSLDRRPEEKAWEQAESIARAALAGYVERSVGSATFYHADYVAPRWAPLLTKLNQIGAHIFYRWPGSWGQNASFNGRYIGEPRDPASLRPVIVAAIASDGATSGGAPRMGPITDGTVLKRAPNDVGGLLDPSKGWTLDIPLPSETGTAAQSIASQQRSGVTPQAAQNGAAPVAHVIASR